MTATLESCGAWLHLGGLLLMYGVTWGAVLRQGARDVRERRERKNDFL
jgi:hypothetical protein